MMTLSAKVRLVICQSANVLAFTLSLVVPAFGFDALSYQGNSPTINLSVLGTWRSGLISSSTPAGPVYDPLTQRVFVGSDDRNAIDVIDVSTPTNPNKIQQINLGGDPNSIAFSSEGILAVSRSSSVRLFNANGVELVTAIPASGAGGLQFTPDGQRLVVSGKSSSESEVTIIDISSPDWDACRQGLAGCTINSTSNVASFDVFNSQRQVLLDADVRLPHPNLSVAADINIADITVSEDSSKAWLTLADNNAVAEVNLQTPQISNVFGLGTKDNSLANNGYPDSANSLPASLPGIRGNGLDPSDVDGAINISTWPIKSFYNPDDIGSYFSGGQTYLVTSNEGDASDDTKDRLNTQTLDPSNPAFPFQSNSNLGRLLVSTVEGDTDGDGDFDETYGYGGRSFAIWTTDGTQVFDSGDDFEQITAAALPNFFNASSGNNSFDNRSDDRGPEPEAFDIGTIAGRTYAFVGFERISGIMVYDITDPFSPTFQQYINNRNFAESPDSLLSEDVEPEGVFFISAEESPIFGVPLIAVSHEKSDSTTLYRIDFLKGDFDGDGDVDGHDFLLWQRGGSETPLSASDLADWQVNFGSSDPLAAAATAVPEPTTWALVIGAAACCCCRRRCFTA
jgi:2',3'-cyclic-nucleotide 2'-phosphodiesterase/3'-nucleotidase/5'-nucleotidase